ncbi:MAG TPA: NAD(P)H-hydrate dehydratase [Pseudomonadales bacterium]
MTAPPSSSPPGLYTAAESRELDRLAIEEYGLPGFDLMQRAGRAAWRVLGRYWPEARRIAVCCGRGNNAGDGYLVAALAHENGLEVEVHELATADALGGDAARARHWAAERGVPMSQGVPEALTADVVVDALLGTGIRRPLRPPFAEMARRINACGAPVLAIDVPTGVDVDTGAADEAAVRATVTVTFIGRKLGLFTGPGAVLAGTVVFDDLGVPSRLYRRLPGVPWLAYPQLPPEHRLGPRALDAYKHALGHLAVVGGDHAMGGAALMAAEAALRTGAGMVSVLTRAAHRPAILARRPETMVVDADDATARAALLERADVLVIGPGLGRDPWGRGLLEQALATGRPAVIDADGLNLIAEAGKSVHSQTVVTPHAAEAARLLGRSVAEVQAARPVAVRDLVARLGGAAVLKGRGSLIAAPAADGTPRLLGVCAHGNPGMASAGMGDVLSGVIGGLLAQGLPAASAALAGTCLHSFAADRAAERCGQRALLALDVVDAMIGILRDEERGWR